MIFGKLFGVGNVVFADGDTTEGCEIGASTEGFADVFGEDADVGAGRDMTADFELWVSVRKDFEAIDSDFASGSFEISARTGELIGTLTVDFNGAETRNGLELFADKLLEYGFNVG